MVKGRALARPSERSERFEPLVRTHLPMYRLESSRSVAKCIIFLLAACFNSTPTLGIIFIEILIKVSVSLPGQRYKLFSDIVQFRTRNFP